VSVCGATNPREATYIACMVKNLSLITIRPRRAPPVLVCKKCLARVEDGKKLKRSLKTEVKRRSIAGTLKSPRIVMTGCFGICPKHAVVLANGATLERGEYLLASDEKSVASAAEILTATSRAEQ
jgi:predicted metal-binding protein